MAQYGTQQDDTSYIHGMLSCRRLILQEQHNKDLVKQRQLISDNDMMIFIMMIFISTPVAQFPLSAPAAFSLLKMLKHAHMGGHHT